MKTFEQFVNEALEKKPYTLYAGGYIYFNSEDTLIEVNKTGRIKDIIGVIATKDLPKYFPSGQKLVFALLGRYLQYLFPNDESVRDLTDQQYASWFVVEKNKIHPKHFKLARGQGWLQPATIDLGYEGWKLDDETKDAWRNIVTNL